MLLAVLDIFLELQVKQSLRKTHQIINQIRFSVW